MNNYAIKYFPQYFSRMAIVTFMIVILLSSLIFFGNHLTIVWFAFAFIEILGFFIFLNVLSKSWYVNSSGKFIQNLFWTSLFIRIAWVFFSYYFFLNMTGIPFGFHAADSLSYHSWAELACDTFSSIGYQQFFQSHTGYSDIGYPIYLTTIYLITGKSIIASRLLMAFWSALTAVLIYKLTRRNFGEAAGRIAGIMAMLLPNFIYYCGLHLKEPLMIFLMVAFAERTDYILRKRKIYFKDIVVIAMLGYSLFFFRTVLGIAAIFALFTALVFMDRKLGSRQQRIITSVWVLILLFIFFSTRIQGEVNYLLENTDSQEANMAWRAEKDDGNKLAVYGRTAVFVPFIVVAPFPTFVSIEMQEQQMMLSGANFIRNIYAFFSILGIFIIIRSKQYKKYIFLLTFLFVYLAILAKSSFAISERFHLPAVSFLLIFASYGITRMSLKYKKLYIPYLVLIAIIIIGWNWFKLAGRGLI